MDTQITAEQWLETAERLDIMVAYIVGPDSAGLANPNRATLRLDKYFAVEKPVVGVVPCEAVMHAVVMFHNSPFPILAGNARADKTILMRLDRHHPDFEEEAGAIRAIWGNHVPPPESLAADEDLIVDCSAPSDPIYRRKVLEVMGDEAAGE